MASGVEQSSKSVVAQATQYIQGSVEELKKVSSPTRAETIQATMVTIFIMVFIALALFAMDAVFSTMMSSLIATDG